MQSNCDSGPHVSPVEGPYVAVKCLNPGVSLQDKGFRFKRAIKNLVYHLERHSPEKFDSV